MPRAIAFTHQGVEFKAFPEAGCFFGVSPSGATLLSVPMLVDGSPDQFDGEPNDCLVEYLGEYPDNGVPLLAAINAEFGLDIKPVAHRVVWTRPTADAKVAP